MKKKIISSIIVASILLTSGCAEPKTPIYRETLKLNLVEPLDNVKRIDKTIIILKPEIKTLKTSKHQRMDFRSQILRMQANITSGSYNFNKAFVQSYGNILPNALKDDLSDILSNEGFIINDEYDSYDDIDFSLKKDAYLIIKPVIEISFPTVNVNKETTGDTLYETGILNTTGYIKLKLLEPLSKTQLSVKKINLSNFNINYNYASVRKIDSGYSHSSAFGIGTAIGKSISSSLFGKNIKDNTETILIKALNKIENNVIIKIKPRLQKMNILSYEENILEIKSKKRY